MNIYIDWVRFELRMKYIVYHFIFLYYSINNRDKHCIMRFMCYSERIFYDAFKLKVPNFRCEGATSREYILTS